MPNGTPGAARSADGAVLVREEPPGASDGWSFGAYGAVPIAFTVREVLDVAPVAGGLGGLALTPRALARPYPKDYDALDGGPARWTDRFGAAAVGRWGVLAAYASAEPRAPRVGGAVVVHDEPGIDMAEGHSFEGRGDLAVLWDLRVAPAHRGRGVGRALFDAAARWARARGARRLVVETQSVNVPACRFYAARGCTLGAVHRFAYPDLPDEARLLWSLELATPDPATLGPDRP